MTDSAAQRLNMVESQVRPSDVTDRRIIRAMLSIPRERFVPGTLSATAYMDIDVPMGQAGAGGAGRYLLAPRTLAKLVQVASIEGEMKVLDIGCATGYSCALVATLAKSVVGLECDAGLAKSAQTTLAALGLEAIQVRQGPLEAGYAPDGPYDVIILNGGTEVEPSSLLDQLRDGGRIVGIVASGYSGHACVWTKFGKGLHKRVVFDAGAHPLPGFKAKPQFVF